MRRLLFNDKGDTIIEVLIAVTVIGLSIGLAYGVANRSLKSARQSQERTEAVKLAEGQTEQLKALSYEDDAHDQGIFSVGQTYCLKNGEKKVLTGKTIGSLDSDDLNDYGECQLPWPTGLYKVAVVPKSNNNFEVYVRWFGIGQLDKEELKITYRLYTE
jgi:type II secretory pathway pseudopilin PulG